MRSVLVVLALVLAGCVSKEPEVRTVRVEVPVLVPCKTTLVAVPPWAAQGLKKSDSLELKVRALLAERRQRIGYERELVAAVVACQ
jgi:lipoprotein NlpI